VVKLRDGRMKAWKYRRVAAVRKSLKIILSLKVTGTIAIGLSVALACTGSRQSSNSLVALLAVALKSFSRVYIVMK
jgi:hypothetical protein